MVKFRKCNFCLANIGFLGHIVGRDGLQPDPKKIEKMKNLPSPQTLTQLRAAVGLFSYYRKFVPQFVKIAKPMTELMIKQQEFKWNEEA